MQYCRFCLLKIMSLNEGELIAPADNTVSCRFHPLFSEGAVNALSEATGQQVNTQTLGPHEPWDHEHLLQIEGAALYVANADGPLVPGEARVLRTRPRESLEFLLAQGVTAVWVSAWQVLHVLECRRVEGIEEETMPRPAGDDIEAQLTWAVANQLDVTPRDAAALIEWARGTIQELQAHQPMAPKGMCAECYTTVGFNDGKWAHDDGLRDLDHEIKALIPLTEEVKT